MKYNMYAGRLLKGSQVTTISPHFATVPQDALDVQADELVTDAEEMLSDDEAAEALVEAVVKKIEAGQIDQKRRARIHQAIHEASDDGPAWCGAVERAMREAMRANKSKRSESDERIFQAIKWTTSKSARPGP